MKKDEDNKLPLDPSKGYIPNDFDYPSEMPHIKVEATYASAEACMRGDKPIRVDSVEFINPKGATRDKLFRPAISTVYPKTPEETNELLKDVLKMQVLASEGRFMDMPHLPMGAYYKAAAEDPDAIVLSLKNMKVPPIPEED